MNIFRDVCEGIRPFLVTLSFTGVIVTCQTATFYFDSNPLGPSEMYKMGLKVSGATGEAKLKV